MAIEQTLSIIKPDAVVRGCIGEILSRFEKAGLKIVAAKMVHMTQKQAEEFYLVHKNRPFYPSLVQFMSSAPVFVQVLEGENAILRNREIMGATNPKDAKVGTIRADFASSVEHNAVHGSDSFETAKAEITFFFKPEDIVSLR